jgi:hypothetical protein
MHSLIQIDLARTLAQENARLVSVRAGSRDTARSRVPRVGLRRSRVGLRVAAQAAPSDMGTGRR